MCEEGKCYLCVVPFGWVFVGRFRRRLDLHNNVFDRVSYVRRAGKTFAALLVDGPSNETTYETLPPGEMSITNQTLWSAEWPHALPGPAAAKKR